MCLLDWMGWDWLLRWLRTRISMAGLVRSVPMQCVAVSACGHYAFIGYSDGAVHQYALQSGRHVAQIHGKPGV
jgi:hypothetical protein